MTRDAARRLQRISELLSHESRVSVEKLVALLETSPATVRRDLRLLERQGVLARDHGGAVAREPILYEPFLHDSSFQEQVRRCSLEKQRIGMAAAELIGDSETVGLGGGTTVAKMLRGLRTRKDLTVVTYAVNVAMELSRQKNLHVHVTGGYLSGNWFSLVGPRALEAIGQHFLDKFIFGASGVDPERGVTDHHTEESAMNRAMLGQARSRILLVDHTKLGTVSRCLVCPLSDIHLILTDQHAPAETVHALERAGVEVRRV